MAHRRVHRVPAPGDLPGQLEVLDLVLAHRHRVGVVQQDVRRLEDGIAEQTGRNTLEPFGLIFELGHPLQLTQRRDRGEQPVELGMLRHADWTNRMVRVRVDPRGEQADGHVSGPGGEERHVVWKGDGVQIHHADDGIELVLEGDPIWTAPSQLPMCRSPSAQPPRRSGPFGQSSHLLHRCKMNSSLDLLHLAAGAAEAAGTYIRAAGGQADRRTVRPESHRPPDRLTARPPGIRRATTTGSPRSTAPPNR